MIFDTHCHLNSEELYPRIEEVIDSAKKAGIARFLVVGWNKESSKLAVKIAEKYNEVYASVGYHPSEIYEYGEKEEKYLYNLLKKDKVVALGEIGLDYHWSKSPEEKEKQKEWFIKQIKIANECKKPVVIHNREAFEDSLKILNENKPVCGGVMHCYSGSKETLKDVLDLGLYIGLDGPVTFTNAKTPKEVAEIVPLDKLLVETDCPYLTPHPFRGTINEPKNITYIIESIAKLKNLSKKHVAEATFSNACKLFNIEL